MRTIVCLAAKGVIRDAVNNSISIFHILEELTAEGFPVFFQEMAALAIWEPEEGESDAEMNLELIIGTNGKELLHTPVKFQFQDGKIHRHVINLQGVIIPGPGALTIRFIRDGNDVCSYSIKVKGGAPRAETQG